MWRVGVKNLIFQGTFEQIARYEIFKNFPFWTDTGKVFPYCWFLLSTFMPCSNLCGGYSQVLPRSEFVYLSEFCRLLRAAEKRNEPVFILKRCFCRMGQHFSEYLKKNITWKINYRPDSGLRLFFSPCFQLRLPEKTASCPDSVKQRPGERLFFKGTIKESFKRENYPSGYKCCCPGLCSESGG